MYQYNGKVWDLQLRPLEKLVLLYLLDRANKDGECWPGLSSISKATGLSRRAVIDTLKALKAKGLVDWAPGPYGSNLYRVRLDAIQGGSAPHALGSAPHALGSAPHALGSAPHALGSAPHALGVVHDVHPNHPIEPSIEPSIEPTTPPPISPPKTSRPAEEEEGEKPISKPETQNPTPNRGSRVLDHEKISRGPEPGTAPAMTPEQARLELEARKKAWTAPPEPPREMVEALKRADLWERLAALRRYARDTRAWFEWLARALGRLWEAHPSGFTDAVREGLDALARRPDVQSPLLYLERVAAKALEGKRGPEEPSDLPGDAAAFRRYGVPLASGEMAEYVSLSANGRDIIVRHRGELKLVDREAAYARLVRQGLVPKPEGWDDEQELDPYLDGLVNRLVKDVWGEA